MKAGFAFFRDALFDEAFDAFRRTDFDVLLLLNLYPDFSFDEISDNDKTIHKWIEELHSIDEIGNVL